MLPRKIHYHYLSTVDSTNDELKRRIAQSFSGTSLSGAGLFRTDPLDYDVGMDYTVLSAGAQTSGRGRAGHDWESRFGVSVSTSMVLYPKKLSEERIPRITLLAAVAVCEAIEETCALSPKIKWVNDVLLDSRKICGILAERLVEYDAVVVGIGVNVAKGSYPRELADRAACLEEYISGSRKLSKRKLIRSIWEHFVNLYEVFQETNSLDTVLEGYNVRLINRGREVRVMDPSGAYTAICEEADENGNLVITLPDGSVRRIDSGEVSVRGIYGYGV